MAETSASAPETPTYTEQVWADKVQYVCLLCGLPTLYQPKLVAHLHESHHVTAIPATEIPPASLPSGTALPAAVAEDGPPAGAGSSALAPQGGADKEEGA